MWEQTDSGRVQHRFEPLILVLALLIIPVVLVEESHAPGPLKTAARVANWVIWAGFAAEFIAVMIVAPRKQAAGSPKLRFASALRLV